MPHSREMPKNKATGRLNAGLDAFCWMTGNQTLLARLRHIRSDLNGSQNFYSKDLFSKSNRKVMTRAASLGLVRVFQSGYQFRSETKALKELIGKSTISISQKQHVYMTAREFEPGKPNAKKHKLNGTARWRHLSFAIAVNGFLDNTGQQKIANRLGLSRQTVNERTRKNPYLKSKQNWIRITNLFQNHLAHKQKSQSVLNQYKMNAMRIGRDGWLYRQVANLYRLRNINITFEDHKTFRFSNKVLNRYFFTGVARSNCPCPANKYIAMLRAQAKRSNRSAHDIRAKKSRLRTTLEITDDYFGERTDSFQVKTYRGPKMIQHQYRYLKIPYGVLSTELRKLQAHGLVRDHEVYGRKILNGTFNQVSTKGMHRRLRDLRDAEATTVDQEKAMRFLKDRNDYQSGNGRGLQTPEPMPTVVYEEKPSNIEVTASGDWIIHPTRAKNIIGLEQQWMTGNYSGQPTGGRPLVG